MVNYTSSAGDYLYILTHFPLMHLFRNTDGPVFAMRYALKAGSLHIGPIHNAY